MKLRLCIVAVLLASGWWHQATVRAHPPTGIVVDRSGNVYFSDLETIWKLSAEGSLTVFRAGQRGRHVHELAIDHDDNIYGADVSYNPATKRWPSSVWVVSPSGKISYLLETTENPPRGMGIWRDGAGNLYSIIQNNHTKTQTLLLRRTPSGEVTTLAGGAYGLADGKGMSAMFGSIGGMVFGPDGNLYLTDRAAIRKVTLNGEVTTLAKGLDLRAQEDQPRFLAAGESLTGLSVASDGTIFVADSGNRRLLKLRPDGKVDTVLRTEPPYFPNGVAAVGQDVYVLEIGFTLPNISSGPRVRRISADGSQKILVTLGETNDGKQLWATRAGVAAENTLTLVSRDGRWRYSLALSSLAILSLVMLAWRRKRRARA
jgi:sugar lactone lactonase YvrE